MLESVLQPKQLQGLFCLSEETLWEMPIPANEKDKQITHAESSPDSWLHNFKRDPVMQTLTFL